LSGNLLPAVGRRPKFDYVLWDSAGAARGASSRHIASFGLLRGCIAGDTVQEKEEDSDHPAPGGHRTAPEMIRATGGHMPSNKMTTRIPNLEGFSSLSAMPTRFRTLFGEPFTDLFAPAIGWMPSVEVSEKGDEILVHCELPGMSKEDVEIVLQNNVLTIRGEKKEERKEEAESKRYLVYERNYGAFARSFTLPTNVSADKVSATFDKGVLSIHLPKTAEAKDRLIPIKTV
jgi:HSP20 family protein